MKVTMALKVTAFGFVTSSVASGAHQKNVRTTHKDASSNIKKEWKIDVMNQIQLEDQTFWDRSMSMSTFQEGDSSYLINGGLGCCDCCVDACHDECCCIACDCCDGGTSGGGGVCAGTSNSGVCTSGETIYNCSPEGDMGTE
mmetsp:Transcript_21742/g.31158  ORF Transcript_21742/g.31158 Transcript_21742/m.31158 type:complete len:142 (+) Transcript_21742:55-480(+)